MTKTTRMWLLQGIVAIAARIPAVHAVQPQTPYLKEILMGLCYKHPPSPNLSPDMCPTIVGSIMGTIEGRLDHTIAVSDFDFYVSMADLSSKRDHAILWMIDDATGSSKGCSSTIDAWTHILGKESVQTTPGGTLFRDLVFCGVDQRSECPEVLAQSSGDATYEVNGAQSAAWAALFQQFAKNISGHLTMVVMPRGMKDVCSNSFRDATVDPHWIQNTVVPFLQTDSISKVTIYLLQDEDSTCSSSSVVENLQSSLDKAGISSVSCIDDPNELNLLLCSTDPYSARCQWLHAVGEVKPKSGGDINNANANEYGPNSNQKNNHHVDTKNASANDYAPDSNQKSNHHVDTKNADANEYAPNSNQKGNHHVWLLVLLVGGVEAGLLYWKRQKENHGMSDELITFAHRQQ